MLRYRRDLAGSSALGGLFTSREGIDYHNRVGGVDGLFRWGDEALRVEVLRSESEYPLAVQERFGEPAGSLEGTAVRAVYQHSTRTWSGYLLYNEVTADFRADLGFIPQVDFRKGYGFVEGYRYADHGEHWWTKLLYGVESTWTYDHAGNPLQRQVAPYVGIDGPRQSHLFFYLGTGDSFFGDSSFDRNFLVLQAEAQLRPSVYLRIDGRVGQEIDFANAGQGTLVRLTPQTRLDLGRHWRVQLDHTFETLDVHGGRLYTANLTNLRTSYQFNARTFVRLITQYSDVRRDVDLYISPTEATSRNLFNQLLFSYTINPQTVLFLGYSDRYLGGEQTLDSLTQTDRTLFFKVGYAFVF